MSTVAATTQAVTAPRPRAGLGRWLVLAASLLLVGAFFLPWILFTVSASGRPVLTLTGLQMTMIPLVETSQGGVLFRARLFVYVAPLIGLIGLVLFGLALRRGHLSEWDGFLPLALGVFGPIVLWSDYAGVLDQAAPEKVAVHIQLGLGLTFAALAALLIAGALNLREVGARKPAFRAVLDSLGFMAPATVLVIIFYVIPAIILLILSLTDLASSNFSEPWHFVGLENYRRMFNDTFFPKILRNTVQYVVLTLGFFNIGLALVLALLTAHVNRRAGFFFRLLWLLPRITPSVVYIVMWQRIAQQPPYGILNQFLGWVGIERQPYWIPEAPWVFVVLANGFVGASFGMIIFSSAIESIPRDLTIAAKVDGASAWQIIRDITLPLLRWPLLFVMTYQTLSLLVSFEYILLLTNGGPGLFTTEVWALTAYKRALQTYFGSNQWAYGAAWGFVLVVIGAGLSVIYLRVFRFNDLVQEPKIDVL